MQVQIDENLNLDELILIQNKVKQEIEQKLKQQEKEEVESHSDLMGKCFKNAAVPCKYYKVISIKGSNRYHVSMLAFDEFPKFFTSFHAGSPMGEIMFKGIHVESFPFYVYDTMGRHPGHTYGSQLIEISLNEYNQAMDKYYYKMQQMNWE